MEIDVENQSCRVPLLTHHTMTNYEQVTEEEEEEEKNYLRKPTSTD